MHAFLAEVHAAKEHLTGSLALDMRRVTCCIEISTPCLYVCMYMHIYAHKYMYATLLDGVYVSFQRIDDTGEFA
jgi:hypothetical protein